MVIAPFTVDVPMERLPWINWILITLTLTLTFFVWADDRYEVSDAEAARIAEWLQRAHPPDVKRINRFLRYEVTEEDVKWTPEKARWHLSNAQTHPLVLHPAALKGWQPLTNVFVHGHWLTLLSNMLFLFCFGNAVNAKVGHILYLILYLFMGLVSDLDVVLVQSALPVMGASGAVMGIAGIYLVLFPRNDVQVFYLLWAGPTLHRRLANRRPLSHQRLRCDRPAGHKPRRAQGRRVHLHAAGSSGRDRHRCRLGENGTHRFGAWRRESPANARLAEPFPD